MKNKRFSLFEMPLVGFALNRQKIPKIILKQARAKKETIYGGQAMNAQLHPFYRRHAPDYDIYTQNSRKRADEMQDIFDREIAWGRDEFFATPARHPKTHRVMHVGSDMRKKTEDDIPIADYTSGPKDLRTTLIGNIRHQHLSSIEEEKKKILKEPESEYRHEKDEADLERIRNSMILARVWRRWSL